MNGEFSTEYEALCHAHLNILKRYLFHKITNHADAEDILQDILLAAYNGFEKLKDKSIFKSWLIGIASNKCADYYKAKAKKLEIPLDEISGSVAEHHGAETAMLVKDTLNMLRDKDKQILYLFYIRGYSQKDIAAKFGIPLGTVKSRVSAAKEKFKEAYCSNASTSPLCAKQPPTKESSPSRNKKGENKMNSQNKYPKIMPELKIEKIDKEPFRVKFEEIAGWLIVPKVGEKASFAFYDDPDKRYTGMHTMDCVREAEVHGVSCVQVEIEYVDANGQISGKRTQFMRLTETHASVVAEMRIQDNTFSFVSFYDDNFLQNYQYGENNIGKEIDLQAKDIAILNDDGTFTITKKDCADIFGRYKVEIGSRSYDTVAIVVHFDERVMNIQYVDKNGRTVLFRRYNRFDWNLKTYKQLWTEKLPNSEVLTINGEKYVHWYDCIGGAPVRRCEYSGWESDTVRFSQPPLPNLGAEAVRSGLSVGREPSEPQCESVK